MSKAKEYLNQLELFDIKINQKLLQLEELKQRAISVNGLEYKEKVQSSCSNNKIHNSVVKYIELEQKINEDIDKFVDIKNKIINEIQSLEDVKHIRVLFMRYVQYKRLEVIAVELGFSYDYTKHLHGYALVDFENHVLKKSTPFNTK